MSRIPALDPAGTTGTTADLLAAVQATLGLTTNMTRVMANAPVVLDGYLASPSTSSPMPSTLLLTPTSTSRPRYRPDTLAFGPRHRRHQPDVRAPRWGAAG
jgi:hypothetical protein